MSPEARNVPPHISHEWLAKASLSSGADLRAIGEYIQQSATQILGPELYNAEFWNTRMSTETSPGYGLGDRSNVRFFRNGQHILRTFRELSNEMGIDGDDPRSRYWSVRLLLIADELSQKALNKGGVTSVVLAPKVLAEFKRANSARKEEILTLAKEQGRAEQEQQMRDAAEREIRLREYADEHGISDEERESLDARAGIMFRR
jgi:hypothetical protein